MKKLSVILGMVLLLASFAHGQATLNSTTLSVAAAKGDRTISVASASGFAAGEYAYVDRELMFISSVSGTTISVIRGYGGTSAVGHANASTVYQGPADHFAAYDRSGTCTSTDELVLPIINVKTGKKFRCTSSTWDVEEPAVSNVVAAFGLNLDLETVSDGKPVRLNSRNYTATTGDIVGFQSKPAQTVSKTDNGVIGAEISPRLNSGVALAGASGFIIGLHVDVYLKGTAAGTVASDVRALNLELVTDDAGTRTISGNVNAIRIRSAFSATTITGTFVPIRIEKAEAQTGSQQYDAVLDLPSTVAGVWNSAPGTEPSTADGYIKVLVNGAARYIQLYSVAPTD